MTPWFFFKKRFISKQSLMPLASDFLARKIFYKTWLALICQNIRKSTKTLFVWVMKTPKNIYKKYKSAHFSISVSTSLVSFL